MNINSLEMKEMINYLVEENKKMFDKIYPIGTYYETSDSDFDPNESFNGTWARDTIGYVTVGAIKPDEPRDPSNSWLEINNGAKTGEVKHTLTISEIPSHNHDLERNFEGGGNSEWSYRAQKEYIGGYWGTTWKGGDQPHNNIQPSIGVYRWHRVA